MAKNKKVLIVGGGFGGVKAALELANLGYYDVTLLTDEDEFRYYPTLYHVATGSKRSNASIPLSKLFNHTDVKIEYGSAVSLDKKAKTITDAENHVYNYDYLILALGVITNYFGIPGLKEFSYGIKTQSEAARFKNHLHQQLIDEGKPDLNYVIVGAGPTGIELAGALPGYLNRILKNHGLENTKNIHIDLVEAGPRLLPRNTKVTSRSVKRQLKSLGIRLMLDSMVQGLTADALTINGKPLVSHTVVWTAGVTNHPFFKENAFILTSRGKVGVDVYLQAEQDIFVLGDNANTPYSGLAQTALYDGKFVASNLIRLAEGKEFKSYNAKKPISVVPAGPNWAAVDWGKLHFNGYRGYMLREAADLVGFHDLESWPVAAMQFLTEFMSEENCKVCLSANYKIK